MGDLFGRLWDLLGTMHPMVVHFPVALLIVAAFFEIFRVRRKVGGLGVYLPSPTAVACTLLGAVSAGVAVASGWRLGEVAEASNRLEVHRWVAVSAAIVGGLAAVVGVVAQRRPGPRMLAWYRLLVVGGAITVGAAGHFGGELVWGAGYFAKAMRTAWAGPERATGGEDVGGEGGVGTVSFAREVYPILSRRCFACHSGEEPKAGLLLDSREGMLRGGESKEPAIVAGDAAKSLMIRLVSGEDADRLMPPRGDELTSEQIRVLSVWINEGARWGGGTTDEKKATGKGGVDGHWHWAYAAPVKPESPTVTRASWVKGEIDRHVLAGLEAARLVPSAEADRATLLRRLSLDLVGLPPTPEEIDAFELDASSDAVERVVDRLLASPRYGERWARVWLDLARYADTHGYEKDARRVMWPYRDWVIEAYNADMPFDRFTVEQLAGDMLPGATLSQKIATGFNRNTQINEEGGTDPEEFRVEAVLDRVGTVSSVWLGTTLACAQCHDHKYDPLTQKDFFRFYAFFDQDEADAEVVNATGTEKRAAGPMVQVPRRGSDWGEFERLVAEADALRAKKDQSPEPAVIEPLEKRIAELAVAKTLVMGRSAVRRETRVFERGSFLSPGEVVTPGVPGVMVAAAGEAGATDRLGLARWLVDAKNPLTARVQVNRLWGVLFGRGLVETEDDFGTQGEAPTHAGLLDYLAVRYVEVGWSQKALLREIVLSAAYRQSSRVTKEMLEKDPGNRLLSRGGRFRVEAEMVRDIALSASGLLSGTMYGESVFPPQPPGIWTMIYSADQWTESTGEDRYRRGVYTFARRTAPYPAFAGFDGPSREVSCTRRSRTNTPMQALTTLNDPQFVEAAGAMGVRMIREGSTAATRVARGMRLVLGRVPEPAEVVRLVLLAEEQLSAYGKDAEAAERVAAGVPNRPGDVSAAELAAWTIVGNVILNLDEAITRE